MMSSASSGVRRKLYFQPNKDLPLKDKTFFVDIRSAALKSKVIERVQVLGGQIECFLSREIGLVITDKQNGGAHGQRAKSTKENSIQSSASPSVYQPGQRGKPFAEIQNNQQMPLSRGHALLLKASQSQQPDSRTSNDPLQKASELGVKVQLASTFLKSTCRQAAKLKQSSLRGQDDLGISPISWKNGEKENGFVLKVEDTECIFRPIIKHFDTVPAIQCNEEGSPFDVGIFLEKSAVKPKSTKKKKIATVAAKGGYCESCDIWFKCSLRDHIKGAKHKEFVDNIENYGSVDIVTKSMPNVGDFMKKFCDVSLCDASKDGAENCSLKERDQQNHVSQKPEEISRTDCPCVEPMELGSDNRNSVAPLGDNENYSSGVSALPTDTIGGKDSLTPVGDHGNNSCSISYSSTDTRTSTVILSSTSNQHCHNRSVNAFNPFPDTTPHQTENQSSGLKCQLASQCTQEKSDTPADVVMASPQYFTENGTPVFTQCSMEGQHLFGGPVYQASIGSSILRRKLLNCSIKDSSEISALGPTFSGPCNNDALDPRSSGSSNNGALGLTYSVSDEHDELTNSLKTGLPYKEEGQDLSCQKSTEINSDCMKEVNLIQPYLAEDTANFSSSDSFGDIGVGNVLTFLQEEQSGTSHLKPVEEDEIPHGPLTSRQDIQAEMKEVALEDKTVFHEDKEGQKNFSVQFTPTPPKLERYSYKTLGTVTSNINFESVNYSSPPELTCENIPYPSQLNINAFASESFLKHQGGAELDISAIERTNINMAVHSSPWHFTPTYQSNITINGRESTATSASVKLEETVSAGMDNVVQTSEIISGQSDCKEEIESGKTELVSDQTILYTKERVHETESKKSHGATARNGQHKAALQEQPSSELTVLYAHDLDSQVHGDHSGQYCSEGGGEVCSNEEKLQVKSKHTAVLDWLIRHTPDKLHVAENCGKDGVRDGDYHPDEECHLEMDQVSRKSVTAGSYDQVVDASISDKRDRCEQLYPDHTCMTSFEQIHYDTVGEDKCGSMDNSNDPLNADSDRTVDYLHPGVEPGNYLTGHSEQSCPKSVTNDCVEQFHQGHVSNRQMSMGVIDAVNGNSDRIVDYLYPHLGPEYHVNKEPNPGITQRSEHLSEGSEGTLAYWNPEQINTGTKNSLNSSGETLKYRSEDCAGVGNTFTNVGSGNHYRSTDFMGKELARDCHFVKNKEIEPSCEAMDFMDDDGYKSNKENDQNSILVNQRNTPVPNAQNLNQVSSLNMSGQLDSYLNNSAVMQEPIKLKLSCDVLNSCHKIGKKKHGKPLKKNHGRKKSCKQEKSVYHLNKTGDTKLKFCKVVVTPVQQKSDLLRFWRVRKSGGCKLIFSAEKRKADDNTEPSGNKQDTEGPLPKRRRCLVY